MGSFANALFSMMLGWLQGLISMIWSAVTAKEGESFFQYIGNNWIAIAVILCVTGLIADFAVYFFRWTPYKVWRTFWRHLKGEGKEAGPAEPQKEATEPVYAFQNSREKDPDYIRKWKNPEPEYRESDETDELSRWRSAEPETEEPAVPAEITKAGYTVPADSPYRKPGDRNRRRRLRINLLGDSEEDSGIHYYSPRPMMDQKEAYHAPVYPEKWEGSREQDS